MKERVNKRTLLAAWLADAYDDYPIALGNVAGFGQCGRGWEKPVRAALTVLEKHGATVKQIKTKFGGLRLYFNLPVGDAACEECREAVYEAERICWSTCEECGKPGSRRPNSFVQVLCKECYDATRL